ncbi:MAG: hypothetical protein ABIW49_10915 [Knoellia sp.]
MKPPAYAACSLGAPAIRFALDEGTVNGELLGAVSEGEVLVDGTLDGAAFVGLGAGVCLALSDGVGVLLAEVVGLGVGVVSATASDGIPRVSAASAKGAATRTRRAVRSMWGTAFLSGS